MVDKDLNVPTTGLIGTFAGAQIQASESLREATRQVSSLNDRMYHYLRAADYASKAVAAAGNIYEERLAMAQYECAMGGLMLVKIERVKE